MNHESGMLQEIIITTEHRNVVDLQLNEQGNQFRLSGFYTDQRLGTTSWIDFDRNWSSDPVLLFTDLLKNLNSKLIKDGDTIVRIDNPCNDRYLPAPAQRDIVQHVGLRANVTLNEGILRA